MFTWTPVRPSLWRFSSWSLEPGHNVLDGCTGQLQRPCGHPEASQRHTQRGQSRRFTRSPPTLTGHFAVGKPQGQGSTRRAHDCNGTARGRPDAEWAHGAKATPLRRVWRPKGGSAGAPAREEACPAARAPPRAPDLLHWTYTEQPLPASSSWSCPGPQFLGHSQINPVCRYDNWLFYFQGWPGGGGQVYTGYKS